MRVALLLLLASAASAQSPLDAVADALGGRDRIDALEAVVIAAQSDVTFAGQERVVRSVTTMRLPDAMRWDVRARGRTRSVVLLRNRAFSVVDGESQPLALEAEIDAYAESWLHPLVLAARRLEVVATTLSPRLIRVAVDDLEDDVLIGLDDEGRPDLVTTQRRRGERVDYVAVRFSDYREHDGVWFPHRIVQTVSGSKTGTSRVDRIEVGPELAPTVFTDPIESDG